MATKRMAHTSTARLLVLLGIQAQALIKNFPKAMDPAQNLNTIWDFDVSYTAPAGGYRDVDDYYDQCSGKNYLKNITQWKKARRFKA